MTESSPITANTIQEVEELISNFEKETFTRFVVYKVPPKFGSSDITCKKHSILWDETTPYVILASKIYDCHHGEDRKISFKQKYKNKQKIDGSDNKLINKPSLKKKDSKKVNCPAKIVVKEIAKFPHYKINLLNDYQKRITSLKIRKELSNSLTVYQKEFVLSFPKEEDHKNHPTGEAGGISLSLDKQLVDYLQVLVSQGVHKILDMQKQLHEYVTNVIYANRDPPPLCDRRFFPTKKAISAHILRAKKKYKIATARKEVKQQTDQLSKQLSNHDHQMEQLSDQEHQIVQLTNEQIQQLLNQQQIQLIQQQYDEQQIEVQQLDQEQQIRSQHDTAFSKFPQRSRHPCVQGPRCRKIIKSLTNLTYILSDTILEELAGELSDIVTKYKNISEHSYGTLVENQQQNGESNSKSVKLIKLS